MSKSEAINKTLFYMNKCSSVRKYKYAEVLAINNAINFEREHRAKETKSYNNSIVGKQLIQERIAYIASRYLDSTTKINSNDVWLFEQCTDSEIENISSQEKKIIL